MERRNEYKVADYEGNEKVNTIGQVRNEVKLEDYLGKLRKGEVGDGRDGEGVRGVLFSYATEESLERKKMSWKTAFFSLSHHFFFYSSLSFSLSLSW